jgi:glucosamine--fructose-6-phosphate aminotransferase (isomerizing)
LEQKNPEVNNLVDATREILSGDIASSVDSCDLSHEILVLGRGYSYANAREAALKIQETCKVPVQGLSSADYLHGPISALRPSTQVLLMAPYKMPIQSMADALERIRSYNPKIFWIGKGGVSLGGEKAIGGSSLENEIVASIVDAVLMQRFVLELAVRNGLNPDNPAGLSKVTLTL